MSQPFLGQIKIFGGEFVPAGYATCDGQLLPIAQNEALFSLLGTTYGGDGSTNFALPNLRGCVPMHYGSASDLTPRSLGDRGGEEKVMLDISQMPSHTHTMVGTHCPATLGTPEGKTMAQAGYQIKDSNLVMMAPEALGQVGSDREHLNMQPYLTLNFIIALEGTFPSRN